jgi:integrase
MKYAKRLGYYDGVNPVQDTSVNPNAPEAVDGYAYSFDEISSILAVLPEPAATVFFVASFTGLRRGEIEGLEWPDYRDGALWVTRSIWNGTVNEPKTRKSAAPVPVIAQLAQRLELHRLRYGNPQTGPMFQNSIGQRLCLNNILNRAVLPALNRCKQCGKSKGKPHAEQDHVWMRNPNLPQWHGWHAARRGLGSNLYRFGVSEKVIQAILRHSNVTTTMDYYIKSNSSDVVTAMAELGENYAAQTAVQTVRDSDGTLKADTGAMPGSVN